MIKYFRLSLLLIASLISVELSALVYYKCPTMQIPIVPSEKGWGGVPLYENSSDYILAEYSVNPPNHLFCGYSSHPADPTYPLLNVTRDVTGECVKIIHAPGANSDPGDFSCTDVRSVIKNER